MYDPYADFTKQTLINGLEVHSVFWERPWVRVEVIVHTGGREDPGVKLGLAHFVEHLVSKNIPNLTYDQAKEFFETTGGWANFGSTGYLSTKYRFGIPADLPMFRQVLDIFGSMLLEARIEKNIERERDIVTREFNERYPFREKLEWDLAAQRALFPGHRLETWTRALGQPEGFQSVTAEDLQCFYDQQYVPANISLVIVGGFRPEEILRELNRSPFGKRKFGTRNLIQQPLNFLPVVTEHEKLIKYSKYFNCQIDQTAYTAKWSFPADFPHQARRVFRQVLDKILFQEIREKRGLAYAVDVGYTDYQDICEFRIGSQINPNATSSIGGLVRSCLEMIPSRLDLFDRVRKSLLQKYLMTDLSGEDLAVEAVNDLASDQRIITLQETKEGLEQVRFEQMNEMLQFLTPSRQHTFIACS
jgi:predicted Zn-dependent peptidase